MDIRFPTSAFIERAAISGNSLEIRVATDDLGLGSTGGIRIFDGKNHCALRSAPSLHRPRRRR